jgi:hypothetical protein
LFHEKKKVHGFIKNIQPIFFGPRFLPKIPYVLMCIMYEYDNNQMPYCNVRSFKKIKILRIFGH